MSLTNAAEARVGNFLTGNSGATAPTLPLKCRLMTANGSDSAAGTEVTGGTYAAQSVAFSAAADGVPAENADIVRFEGIANPTTVVGLEIWDSAGTPFRWHWAALASNKAVTDGVLEFAAGAITLPVD